MRRTLRRPQRDEAGQALPAYLVAVGVSSVFFVLAAQFVIWTYGRGAVRAALDEAARTGAPADAGVADCEQRAAAVLGDLLGGSMGEGVRVRCTESGTQMQASAEVVFRSWLAPSPDWTFHLAATARKEPAP